MYVKRKLDVTILAFFKNGWHWKLSFGIKSIRQPCSQRHRK